MNTECQYTFKDSLYDCLINNNVLMYHMNVLYKELEISKTTKIEKMINIYQCHSFKSIQNSKKNRKQNLKKNRKKIFYKFLQLKRNI